jgi:hypothetical protein
LKISSWIILAVEHLVREDYKIEAMDRIEAYVDTLLMRMQLIKDRPYGSRFRTSSLNLFILEKMGQWIQRLNNH